MARLKWYWINGRNHLRDEAEESWTAECGLQPLIDHEPPSMVYDSVTQLPHEPCRVCLMVAAMDDDVVDPEPMEIAKARGVMPIDEDDVERLGLG